MEEDGEVEQLMCKGELRMKLKEILGGEIMELEQPLCIAYDVCNAYGHTDIIRTYLFNMKARSRHNVARVFELMAQMNSTTAASIFVPLRY